MLPELPGSYLIQYCIQFQHLFALVWNAGLENVGEKELQVEMSIWRESGDEKSERS